MRDTHHHLPLIRGKRRITVFATLASLVVSANALAQDAILPQGDPRLNNSPEEQARRDEARDSRLKQQGQGPNYRVEGELQGGERQSTVGDPNGPSRQDTGLADPSVNPGQASGMKHVQGRIIKSENKTHTVRLATGGDTTLMVDDRTRGDTDLRPGDVITGILTPQGRAVMVQKAPRGE
ncbi:MAG TPA: hypothetical protein VJ746_01620 [Nitrospira sp.]|nr:hypothetical protein [Nitrospira sp.]